MITPKKHLNLDVSVLRVSAIMLRELKKRRIMEFSSLRHRVLKSAGGDAELVFSPSLSFLFLLGKLEYHVKNDSFEYRDG